MATQPSPISDKSRNHAPLIIDVDAVRHALERAGCRYTAQRGAVFGYLESAKTHPTAEEVYLAVRERMPRISLATVYKALEALVSAQLATKLTNGDGSARYDSRGEEHYHLRDVGTGAIHDLPVAFDHDLLGKLDPDLIQRLAQAGFEVTGYRLEVLGRYASATGETQWLALSNIASHRLIGWPSLDWLRRDFSYWLIGYGLARPISENHPAHAC